jgi:UPF0755 protein
MARRRPRAPGAPAPKGGSGVAGIVLSLVFSAVAAAATLAVLLVLEWNRPGPGAAKAVVVERGAGASVVGRMLEREGVVRSSSMFRLAAEVYARAGVKAGEYALPARASIAQILQQMVDGAVVRHTLTVPEGVTSAAVVQLLAAAPVLAGPVPEPPAEGSILPETYTFERGETRAALLARMQEAQTEVLEALWAQRAPGLPIANKADAVILASIVEKETGLAQERPMVAAVFVNRLRRGMRLESDPTIIYGLTKGVPLGRGLRRSEIDRPNAYNTYQIDGLPPTPIANPGRAALEAVLNPPASEALFFVADGTGGHAFAPTYAQHEANVRRWREIERARAQAAAP